jgi:hypothetical protein
LTVATASNSLFRFQHLPTTCLMGLASSIRLAVFP